MKLVQQMPTFVVKCETFGNHDGWISMKSRTHPENLQ